MNFVTAISDSQRLGRVQSAGKKILSVAAMPCQAPNRAASLTDVNAVRGLSA